VGALDKARSNIRKASELIHPRFDPAQVPGVSHYIRLVIWLADQLDGTWVHGKIDRIENYGHGVYLVSFNAGHFAVILSNGTIIIDHTYNDARKLVPRDVVPEVYPDDFDDPA